MILVRFVQWVEARETYRRQLKRIHLTGFLRGEAINHFYDYINMRPRHFWHRAFDPCAIAPKASLPQARTRHAVSCFLLNRRLHMH